MNIYVATGVTSNLFASLLPSLCSARHIIYGTLRKRALHVPGEQEREDALRASGVQFVDECPAQVDRILWLSPHDDPEHLARLVAQAPTLFISSAAVMDYYRGAVKESALNTYQRSKLSMMRVRGVSSLVPGFYLEDMGALPKWASQGLHGASSRKLFADTMDTTFDWTKCYSVTPKSALALAITGWIFDPTTVPIDMPVMCCSECEYSRAEIRQLSGLPLDFDIPFVHHGQLRKYSQFTSTGDITHGDVVLACQEARDVFSGQKDSRDNNTKHKKEEFVRETAWLKAELAKDQGPKSVTSYYSMNATK